MSSAPADGSIPSPPAKQALEIIRNLSDRDQTWILEQIESMQTVNVEDLSPELKAELIHRIQTLQDGSEKLYDFDEIEQQALSILDR